MTRWRWSDELLLPAGQALLESIVAGVAIAAIGAGAESPVDLRTRMLAILQITATLLGVLHARTTRLTLPVTLACAGFATVAWLHQVLAPSAPWTLATFRTLLSSPSALCPGLSLPLALLVWATAALQVGRGLMVGLTGASAALVLRSFMRGIAVLVALLSLIELASIRFPPALSDALLRQVLGYFALGFALVALAQRRAVAAQHGLPQPLSLAWLAACLPPIVLAFALALTIARGRSVVTTLMHGVTLLGDAVALALVGLAHALVALLRWIGSMLPESARHQTGRFAEQLAHATDIPTARPRVPPVGVEQLDVRPYLLVPVALLLVFLYLGMLSRARRPQEELDEQSTSAWSWRLFGSQLGRALTDAQARLRALSRQPAADKVDALTDARAIYRAFLRWAQRRGHVRAASLTPLEFHARLSRSIPEADPQMVRITARYLEARYAEQMPSETELARARDDLRTLESETALGTPPPLPPGPNE